MAEPKKDQPVIDVKEDEHIATYKPMENDSELQKSKSSLAKSKEKLSADGAEEKLLKEEEAKITIRIDMADAKFVVGDHRNGDAKIELDANKRINIQYAYNCYTVLNRRAQIKIRNRSVHEDKSESSDTPHAQTILASSSNTRTEATTSSGRKVTFEDEKPQFAGLTKEELMKFADDPFWVRVRWFMFALFWVLWLAMLGGAVAIIVCAPKCRPPEPKKWYQKGPLIDTTPAFLSEVAQEQDLLPNMKRIGAQGLVVAHDEPYKVLDDEKALDEIKSLVNRAKEFSVKVIVDLTVSFVLSDHAWFQLSANKTGEYADYFVWANGTDYDDAGQPKPPNNWVSRVNTPAWSWSERRKQFYYHQLEQNKPQLNFHNPAVVRQLDRVMRKYMEAGVAGVRLEARGMLVDESLSNEVMDRPTVAGADHTEYRFWLHKHTTDHLDLPALLRHWAHLVDHVAGHTGTNDTVFTITESGDYPELYRIENDASFLRPPSAAPLDMEYSAKIIVTELITTVPEWPFIQLTQAGAPSLEAAAFGVVLPATPILHPALIHYKLDNVSQTALDSFARLLTLRQDAIIHHGNTKITAVPSHNSTVKLLVCARWKPGHTGYAAIWNHYAEHATADLSVVTFVPATVTLYYASPRTRESTTLYDIGHTLDSTKVLVPPKSTVVLSFVPNTTAKK